ncbi:serine/threonine-protein kinase [Micromonospora coxensis]|uniref:non-specific serine/threonine protein kinase n=1 Tax=Micromonospora coxensis TaxID=356852 RepID=A0A1C5IIE3_9ACTN|nr:serine/threonine-protein kinase [Micromonospora coxensis]SCG57791.1 serine/threonine protein kinase [Micromonospora coxensis]
MQIGQFLNGRYRLGDRIGKGGTSVVHRAYDELLEREVAVKLLLGSDRAARRRIRAEAKAAARLSHPNVTSVYDYGEAVTLSGEFAPFVVMELLPGPTLFQRLAEGALPPVEGLRICAEVAAALAAAHAQGLVHRDVKPANVMLTPSGAKVVDFGTAAAVGQPEIDFDGQLLGTPSYLAPERLDAGEVVPASDVYALGLLVHLVLTDRLPWETDTPTQMLRAHVYVEPKPLPPVDAVPAEVAELCRRCLAKDPAERPSAEEAATVLAAVVTRMRAAEASGPEAAPAGPPGGVAVPGRGGAPEVATAAGPAGTPDRPRSTRRPYRSLLVVGGAVVIAVAVAGSLADSSRPHRPGTAVLSASAVPSAGSSVASASADPPTAAVDLPGEGAGSGRSGEPARTPGPAGVDGRAPTPPASGQPVSPPASPVPSSPAPQPDDTVEPQPSGVPVQARGGTVRVACDGRAAEIVATTPAAGYRIEDYRPGPARQVHVVFGSDAHASDVTARCANGRPVPRVRESDR